MLQTLLLMMLLDIFTGYLSGAYLGKLSSKISFKGTLKKIVILIMVIVGHRLDQLGMESIIQNVVGFPIGHPARSLIIFFYLGNEGLSLIENIGKVVPLPGWITKFFETLKDRGDGKK
jgi:toxin secretion/phage lysis holin